MAYAWPGGSWCCRGGHVVQKFRKGVGGQRGLSRRILPMPEIEASFLYLFPYAPLGEGGHIAGAFSGLFWGVCLSPTPSRQPHFETSEWYRHIRNSYLSNSKTFQDGNGNGNGNFGEVNSKDFLDGTWESMEMKGRLRGPRR